MAERLACWPMVPGSTPHLDKTPNAKKASFSCREFSDLHEKLSCTITPGCMSLLNCEIYQRGRVSTIVETELILMIAHLIVRRMS